MENESLEITNEDLLLEIGKLYIQNVFKEKLINTLTQQGGISMSPQKVEEE